MYGVISRWTLLGWFMNLLILNLVIYLLQVLIEKLLEDDEPPFKDADTSASADVHTMKHPSDDEIHAWPEKKLKSELKRRGFLFPPYKFHDSFGTEHTIGKDAASTSIGPSGR